MLGHPTYMDMLIAKLPKTHHFNHYKPCVVDNKDVQITYQPLMKRSVYILNKNDTASITTKPAKVYETITEKCL
jgi:hypothetical protein